MERRYLLVLRPAKDFVDQDLQFKKFRNVFEKINHFHIKLIEIFHFRKDDYYMIHVIAEENSIVHFIWFLMSEIPAYSNKKIELFELATPLSVFNFTFFDVFDERHKKRVFNG